MAWALEHSYPVIVSLLGNSEGLDVEDWSLVGKFSLASTGLYKAFRKHLLIIPQLAFLFFRENLNRVVPRLVRSVSQQQFTGLKLLSRVPCAVRVCTKYLGPHTAGKLSSPWRLANPWDILGPGPMGRSLRISLVCCEPCLESAKSIQSASSTRSIAFICSQEGAADRRTFGGISP